MTTLSNLARTKVDELFTATAKAHGGVINQQFNVEPVGVQRMEERISADASWFYKLIQVMPMTEKSGDVILMSASGMIGGRTNTDDDTKERKPRSLFSLVANTYNMLAIEWDTHLRYQDLNAWALQKNFKAIYGSVVRKAIARSRIVCGWHGTSRATDTNIVTNTMLQDVNKGWLQRIREYFAQLDGNGDPVFTDGTYFIQKHPH